MAGAECTAFIPCVALEANCRIINFALCALCFEVTLPHMFWSKILMCLTFLFSEAGVQIISLSSFSGTISYLVSCKCHLVTKVTLSAQ